MEYLVGIYARLSVEHGNAKDNSIQNQIRLAKQWLEEQNAKLAQKKIRCESLSEKQKEEGICVADRCRLQDIYVDSGCSGTTFRRPQFQRIDSVAEHLLLCALAGIDQVVLFVYLDDLRRRMSVGRRFGRSRA